MSMSGDRPEQIRAKLATLKGPARVGPLMELAQELVNRYWEIGPGRPEALPLLNEAIQVSTEAYGYFDAQDPWRRPMAARLGTLIGARHLGHGSPDDERRRAIALLEDGLRLVQPAPALEIICRTTLGQLYLVGTSRALNGVNLAALNAGTALPPGAEADVDRAIGQFRKVLDSPGVPAEAHQVAESLLKLARALGTIVSALRGGASMDTMNKIMEAVTVIQRFHQEQSARAGRGWATGVVPLYDADRLAEADPLDRPVMMMNVKPAAAPEPRARSERTPPAGDRMAPLRSRLRDTIAHGGELFAAIEALLAPDARPPGADDVDDIVALATAVVDSGRANRTDHLLLALGLLLRARLWGAPANHRDVDDAADHLLRAAGSPAPPGAIRVMRALAAALDALRPATGAAARLATLLPTSPGVSGG
jgi:hypothetical protein